ncbi:MAG: DUF721 domain-containing protein [Syntrophales bacterium]|nr:DUF721 domain-containing protein [Syntrophales bacterium]
MTKRTAKPKLQPLGDIIHKLFKKQRLPLVVADRSLRVLWDRAVGPQVAAQTFPEEIRRDTLYIRVASSVWLHQLQYLKHEILEKFNQFSGREPIRDIKFFLGEVASSPATKRPIVPSEESHLRPRDREIIAEATASVADPELRRVIERAMRAEIGRRRFMEKQRGPRRSF